MFNMVTPYAPEDPSKNLFADMLKSQQVAKQIGQAPLDAAKQQAQMQLLPQETKSALAQAILGEKKAQASTQQLPLQTAIQAQLLRMSPKQKQATMDYVKAETKAAETKSLFTPQAALTQAVAKARTKAAGADPLAGAEAKQLVKDTASININASTAKDQSIPLYNAILKKIPQVWTSTGPIAGKFSWMSTDGQELRSLLRENQGYFIKQFHLGRMTQVEFNILRQAVGGENVDPTALRNIIERQLNSANRSIKKQAFYTAYMKKGGRSATEATNNWLNEVGGDGAKQEVAGGYGNENQTFKASDGKLYTRQQLAQIASQGAK